MSTIVNTSSPLNDNVRKRQEEMSELLKAFANSNQILRIPPEDTFDP